MGRPSSVDRLVRLLALPAWVAEHPGASFDEAAAHFGVGARTIERDVYTLWVSGLPGGLPDALVDFDADDFESRRLRLTRPLGLDRPIRLSREEAVSLLLALRVLIGLLDADAEAASPLRRAESAVSALLGYERSDSAPPPDAPTGGDGLPIASRRRGPSPREGPGPSWPRSGARRPAASASAWSTSRRPTSAPSATSTPWSWSATARTCPCSPGAARRAASGPSAWTGSSAPSPRGARPTPTRARAPRPRAARAASPTARRPCSTWSRAGAGWPSRSPARRSSGWPTAPCA